jgi:glutathione S-transferase
VLDGTAIFDSSRILAEIERARPDPPLYPTTPAERERALEIERHFDREVAPDLRRLFWSTYLARPADCARLAAAGFSGGVRRIWRAGFPLMRPLFSRNMGLDRASVALARARLGSHFDRLEAEIGHSGFLVGDRFTIADLAAASVMTAIIRPPQFPYPLPEPWPPELLELRQSVADRAGFRWVLGIYARHRDPSSEVS